ncbi:hypothetical protein [Microbacterium sp. NPDC096154]|uniref:hypothetical protein n=1 Tax=Microbacterium sp. NPDC096154 TaxID=3155549 RepID=UPI003333B241
MSGLDIVSGGAIAVSTEQLREAAARFDRVSALLSTASHSAMSAQLAISPPYDRAPAQDVAARAGQASIAVGDTARALRRAADVYEAVEGRVRLALLGHQPAGADRARDARMIEARLAAIEERTPGAREESRRLLDEWAAGALPEDGILVGVLGAALGAGGAPAVRLAGATPLGILLEAVAVTLAVSRRDAAHRGEVGMGASADVRVRVVSSPAVAGKPPAGAADVAARIPSGASSRLPETRIRVERYTFADGHRRFGVYITGTRDWSVGPAAEPWNGRSNLQLYFGEAAASSQAVFAALEQAGARPGDVIDIAAHSQGVLAGNVVAASDQYRVASLIGFGGPQVVQLGDGALALQLSYDEDPVAALAAGGLPVTQGAADSLVVTGDFDGDPSSEALVAEAHDIGAISRLAAELDASTDPRADAIRAHFAELGTAVSTEVIEVAATRVSASSSEGAG